ncbi:NADH dehydrogenase [ubiquinone] 1 beta subcomplex subunit 5, mitochondrial [Ceratina calcarata]|uniref:NADH dehydrogenase [ubiquinone] 1 beta subcomplex subunit 5, mitochondrial n=1 Tax=Ceratina calcarata TaxID=156304 RepID=A0AAJ7J4B0_9HYME|nr:NADH dehydrogenase [ubiquinone] 1 beta subcomplex subunit 5, mitochondrial [Ceratina calcarata]
MAVLSRLFLGTSQKLSGAGGIFSKLLSKNTSHALQNQGGVRCMAGHHGMDITASRWQWHKTKDFLHFYFFVGAIPALLIITYCNVFIGPATLEKIPEGYIPKQWEYYRHPITRFISKYISLNIQMEYEKHLHRIKMSQEKAQLTALRDRTRELIANHGDYKYFSYKRGTMRHIIDIRNRLDENEVNMM